MIQKQEKTEESKGLGQQPLDEQISASSQKRKYPRLSPEVLGVIIAIALATGIRVAVISLGWQTTNSDEDTMGLMALHIAYRGELPVFFYGQNYMGALEAYIGALLFHLLGPSLFSLRLGLVFLFDLFLLVMYLLARLLYTKRLALATIFLLCFGSTENFTRQIKAVGGALETILFSSLMLLLASWLVLSYSPETPLCRLRGPGPGHGPGPMEPYAGHTFHLRRSAAARTVLPQRIAHTRRRGFTPRWVHRGTLAVDHL